MAWGKGKTEKGQGGKLGHSNRDGWGYHDEEKVIAKKQRRLEQKRLISDEISKIDENLRERVKTLTRVLTKHELKFEIYKFDSGAAMIDIWANSDFYCIQMTEDKFGWSKVDEDSGFSATPDSGYLNWSNFKNEFDEIIKKYT
ncbi:hypothetical protein QQ008_24655 [Fulvivirgaceae bacterium BMA10]|uniref:Uncharacterized protein n=1 Tax=Splendidivirga corallicola TaxID=3051826 RepID=A0ABT8KUZ7_9BACT|nr:hypothetical protein [Fulvivirgaceae bacterium BMA10]